MEDYQKYEDDQLECILEVIPMLPLEYPEYLFPVFRKLPKEVVDFVQDNLAFMFVDTSCFLAKKDFSHTDNKDLIVLYIDGDFEKEYADIIAHEIAHAYLGHGGHAREGIREEMDSMEWQRRIETEADDLIEKWGFTRQYSKERENLF